MIVGVGVFILGAIIGSFLNALSFRYNTGRTMAGRSRCMHCGHSLAAVDLVPIVSFLNLRGRCRYCDARLSLQYPLVEGASAFLALLVFLTHPETLAFFFWLLVWETALFIIIYDLRHQVIPWICSIVLIVLALFYLLTHYLGIAHAAAGPLLALPLLLISFFSRGAWMGWGDGVLELSLGWLLGLSAGLTALVIGFWSGALVGIVLLVLSKRYTMKSEIPFAPFLILGAAVSHFFHVDFFSILTLLS